jgi:hypothetical protein
MNKLSVFALLALAMALQACTTPASSTNSTSNTDVQSEHRSIASGPGSTEFSVTIPDGYDLGAPRCVSFYMEDEKRIKAHHLGFSPNCTGISTGGPDMFNFTVQDSTAIYNWMKMTNRDDKYVGVVGPDGKASGVSGFPAAKKNGITTFSGYLYCSMDTQDPKGSPSCSVWTGESSKDQQESMEFARKTSN